MARRIFSVPPSTFGFATGATLWTARTAGTQVTDLLNVLGAAVTTLTHGQDGGCTFSGPADGTGSVWLQRYDLGADTRRVRVTAEDWPSSDLGGTYGPTAVPMKAAFAPKTEVPSILSLVAGQPDEAPTVSGCTLSAETTIKTMGVQSHKLAVASATTVTFSSAVQEKGPKAWSAFGVLIYLADATKVTALTGNIYTDSGAVNNYGVNGNKANSPITPALNLVTGWNLLRWPPTDCVSAGAPSAFGNCDHIRLVFVTNAATDIYVQQVFAEIRPKASLLFILDGGYTLADASPGYADLKARNIPVTWSIDCGLIGDATHVTEARLAQLGAENGNSIGFHGWDGTATSSMTAAQVQAATMKCIKYLAARGWRAAALWRSAWLQNSAPQSAATNSMVLANPMYGADNVEKINAWPFLNMMNVVRHQLHGAANALTDAKFAELQQNHGVMVAYTHYVNDAGGSYITTAEWAYLLAKIDAGIAGGWLEFVTFETLLDRSGIQPRRGPSGGWTVEWPSATGTNVVTQLP